MTWSSYPNSNRAFSNPNRRWKRDFAHARVILQYESLLANPELISLATDKNFNTDFLFAYQVNAWTAFYAGYDNLRNIALMPTSNGSRIVHTPNDFINNAQQFFARFSFLVRF